MSDLSGILFYIGLFTLSAILIYIGKRRAFKAATALGLIIPSLVAGYRYGVGTDFFTYERLIGATQGMTPVDFFANNEDGIELGFYLMSNLSFGQSYIYFTLASFLTLLFIYLGMKRYRIKNVGLFYFLILLIFFPLTLNLVRQGISMAIFFYASSFIYEGRLKKYLLWVVIAGLFHLSALLLIPVYFIKHLYREHGSLVINILKYGLLLVICIGLVAIAFPLVTSLDVFGKYVIYDGFSSAGNYTVFYIKLLLTGIFLILYKWLVRLDRRMVYIMAFAIIDLALSVGTATPLVERVGLYFSIFPLVILARIPNIFSDRPGRFISWFLIVVYAVAYFLAFYYLLGRGEIFPYVSIF